MCRIFFFLYSIAWEHRESTTSCVIVDTRELNVKIVLFGISSLFAVGIAVYDGDISYSTTETIGYKSFRYGLPRN